MHILTNRKVRKKSGVKRPPCLVLQVLHVLSAQSVSERATFRRPGTCFLSVIGQHTCDGNFYYQKTNGGKTGVLI